MSEDNLQTIVDLADEATTAKGKRYRLAFFVGNRDLVLKKQVDAERHGTKSFFYYQKGGYAHARLDTSFIMAIKRGNIDVTPDLSKCYSSNAKLVKNIKHGLKVLKQTAKE